MGYNLLEYYCGTLVHNILIMYFGGIILRAFNELPMEFQNESVKKYYNILAERKTSLKLKRAFDIIMSLIVLVFLIIPILIIALLVKLTSKGPVFYRQVRVTTYNREFRIFKFRTMVVNADKMGALVTAQNDPRVTKIGSFLRKYRLDELPQIFNVLIGDMSFVGTRPEVPKYVAEYKDLYYATLLMPAGITSLASIKFKNEDKLLAQSTNIDDDYIKIILPKKMKYNLVYIENFSVKNDISLMFKTIKEVFS